MILEWGAIETLKGRDWYCLEVRSEKTIEATMRRVGNAIKGIFREDPIEIFIPVFKRDLDTFDMGTTNLIFVRSVSLKEIVRLVTVTGVVQLMTKGETKRIADAIPISDDYVQGLIKQVEAEHAARGEGIEVGSFVRILNGEMRDFCGTVEVISAGRAAVRIVLKTKTCLNETPVKNLLNLSHVPKELRVYYYGPLVQQLVEDFGEEGLKMIAEDLSNEETAPLSELPALPEPSNEPKRHTRQRTVTALVRKLILLDKIHEPMEISKKVIAALRAGEVKAPKNLFIVYTIVKDNISKLYFKQVDPSITNYRDVIHKYGRKYKFSTKDIFKLDPELGISEQSKEICKDGRSREARMKLKAAKQAKLLVKKVIAPVKNQAKVQTAVSN